MEKTNKQINYIELVKNAWQFSWKNKVLWWFGFFAALASGGSLGIPSGPSEEESENFEKVSEFFSNHLNLIIAGAIILFVLFLIFIVLSIWGRAALIKSIEKIKKGGSVEFKSGMKESKKYFWRIFLIGIINALFILVPTFVIAIPTIFFFVNKNYVIGTFLAIIGILIIIFLALIVYFLKSYGYIYAVLGELSAWQSIENAYFLLLKNISSSIIMLLIFFITGMIFGIVIIIFLIPLVLIFLLIGLFLYLILKTIGIAITIGLAVLTFIATLLFLKAIYETFAQTLWILFFHEIAESKMKEEIILEEIKTETIPTPEITN